MPTNAVISRRGYLRLAKETTWNTPVAATVSLPTDERGLHGLPARISPDVAINTRGRDVVGLTGRRQAGGSIGGPAYGVTIGHILMAAYGADVVTGAGPYTHTFGHALTVPSYTFEQNRGGITGASGAEQFAGCILQQLQLTSQFDQDAALLAFKADFIGAFPTLITPTTYVAPADKPAIAAKCTVNYNSASWAKAMQVTANIVNGATPLKVGANSVEIQNAIATDLEVHGSCKMIFDLFTAEYADWTANNQKQLDFLWTFESAETLKLTIPTPMLSNWQFNDKGRFVEASFDWRGISAAGTPSTAILINQQSAAY